MDPAQQEERKRLLGNITEIADKARRNENIVPDIEGLERQLRNLTIPLLDRNEEMRQFAFLKRFIITGTEKSTYQCQSQEKRDEMKENQEKQLLKFIECLQKLLYSGQGEMVLRIAEEYNRKKLVSHEPLITVFAQCALCNYPEVSKKAYERMLVFCSSTPRFFFFNSLCQEILATRKRNIEVGKKRKFDRLDSIAETPPAKRSRGWRSCGWGHRRRKAVASFYTSKNKSPESLLLTATRCRQRYNWTHRQILGLCHAKVNNKDPLKQARELTLCFLTRGISRVRQKVEAAPSTIQPDTSKVVEYMKVLEEIKKLPHSEEGEKHLIEKLREHGCRETPQQWLDCSGQMMECDGSKPVFHLLWEHIPTHFLKRQKVWEFLLQDMPPFALIRNLGRMSALNLFQHGNDSCKRNTDRVLDKIQNELNDDKCKIHPLKILIASKYYADGKGDCEIQGREWEIKKGKKKERLQWTPNPRIKEALETAFVDSFKNVKNRFQTTKKIFFAIDGSDSMHCGYGCHGCPSLKAIEAAVGLAYVMSRNEKLCTIKVFKKSEKVMEKVKFKKNATLQDSLKQFEGHDNSQANVSQAIQHALEKKVKDIDAFVIITDGKPLIGNIQPRDALKQYRDHYKRNTKLIVCSLQASDIEIADPNDPYMFDIEGFSCDTPQMILDFINT